MIKTKCRKKKKQNDSPAHGTDPVRWDGFRHKQGSTGTVCIPKTVRRKQLLNQTLRQKNTANIAENTTKSAATVTHYEYTTEEVKETIQGIFEWAKSLTNADELIDKTFLEGADTSLNDWFAFAAARSGYKEDYKSYRKAMETAIAKKYGTKKEKLGKATEYQRAALVIAALGGDPQAVSDMAGEKTINLIADGTYNRGKTEPLDTQGTNALIWH